MDSGPLEQLARGLYYAPFPALAVNAAGRVVDYNLAFEVLVGADLNGHRYQPLEGLLGRLARRVAAGQLVPGAAELACVVNVEGLGPVRLTAAEVVCHEGHGEPVGRIFLWAVAVPEGEDRFHLRYRDVLDHQLTWDTYAWSYDRVLNLMPYYQETLDRHLAALATAADGPVIDIGAGTGNLVEQLVGAGRLVTAVDNSRAMLDKLRSKPPLAAAAAAGRLTVMEANAEVLPMLADASFAGASILLALFDMDAPDRALDTAVRLLRPGGVVVVTELRRMFQLEPILQECDRRLRQLGRYEELAADLDRVVRSNYGLAPGSRNRVRAEDVFDILTARGFRDVSLTDSHFGQCATISGRKPDRPSGHGV